VDAERADAAEAAAAAAELPAAPTPPIPLAADLGSPATPVLAPGTPPAEGAAAATDDEAEAIGNAAGAGRFGPRGPYAERVTTSTGGAQTEPDAAEETTWSRFDLGRSLKLLHDINEGTVRRTLRLLHIRFWHAPAKRMTELLKQGGAPQKALNMVASVVDTCRACRNWTRPGPRSMTRTTLATHFNELVQWDIVFIREDMLSHCVDEAIRLTRVAVMPDKTAESVTSAITRSWIRQYGPMKYLTADGECALTSHDAAIWADRHGIELRIKPPGAHAQLVERHHEIYRQIVHRVTDQLASENIAISKEDLYGECEFVKNAMISVGGQTPLQGLLGRQPAVLSEFEPTSETQLDDTSGGAAGVSRHVHRLREIAVQSMVEHTAMQRMRRAEQSKSRKSIQSLELEIGDEVDIYRPPTTKDDGGWAGPAQVMELFDGGANVRHQGRLMRVKTQDLRRSLAHLTFMAVNQAGWARTSPANLATQVAEDLQKSVVRVGWILSAHGWIPARDNQRYSEVLLAVLYVAACGFRIDGCIGARLGANISLLEGVVACDDSILWFWKCGRPAQSWYYESSGTVRLHLTKIFGPEWPNYAFIQFLRVGPDDVQRVRDIAPTVPHVGGPNDDRFPKPMRVDSTGTDGAQGGPPAPPTGPPPMAGAGTVNPAAPSAPPATTTTPANPIATPPVAPPPKAAATLGLLPLTGPPPAYQREWRPPPKPTTPRRPAAPARPARSATAPPAIQPSPKERRNTAGEWERDRRVKPRTKSRDPSEASTREYQDDRDSDGTTLYPLTPSKRDRSDSLAEEDREKRPRPSQAASSSAAPPPPDEPILPVADDGTDSDLDEDTTDHELFTETPGVVEMMGDYCFSIPVDAAHYCVASMNSTIPSLIEEEPAELAFAGYTRFWLQEVVDKATNEPEFRNRLNHPDAVAVVKTAASGQKQVVIERDANVLTLAEAKKYEKECVQAMVDELRRWYDLKTFRRKKLSESWNVLDSRWVLKWKYVSGEKIIKARLTVRGFRDLQQQGMRTFSATASRWGQRLIVSTVVQHGWELFSADVSQAFLRGLTFEEIALLPGEKERSVQFRVPPGSVPLLRLLDGYADFNPLQEVLDMIRPGFGLKDAPRAWNLEFSGTLRSIDFLPTHADGQLFVRHHQEKLVGIVSSHVDDAKGGADPEVFTILKDKLEKKYGKMKWETGDFEHTGVKHEKVKDGYVLHQEHYAQQLRPLALDEIKHADADDDASEHLAGPFVSLVCGMAWLLLTCSAIAVYISYLQRHLKKPKNRHLKEANRVLRYVKKHPGRLFFRRLVGVIRFVVISDSAFHAGEHDGLATRGAFYVLMDGNGKVSPGGNGNVLDYVTKKQSHVCRATFGAELHALLDAVSHALKMLSCLHEVEKGIHTAAQLVQVQERGGYVYELHACIDAKSVFDICANPSDPHPADEHLTVHVLKVKEWLQRAVLRVLWWIDTRDMLADGLTKGKCLRDGIEDFTRRGVWSLVHEAKRHEVATAQVPTEEPELELHWQ